MPTIFGVFLLAFLISAVFQPASAQHATKVPLIGILGSSSISGAPRSLAIRKALRELGYIEGQNIAFEERYHEGTPDRRRRAEIVADLVRLKVDVIVVAGGDGVIRWAMDATNTIPILLTGFGSDPVRAGFVKSLARPGGNVTGLTSFNRALGGKRLELLKDAILELSRVAVLFGSRVPGTAREVKEDLPVAGRSLGVTVEPWEVRTESDFDKVFASLNKEPPGALYVPGGGLVIRSNYNRITSFALKSRLPSMFTNERLVEAGGLMSYHADTSDRFRRVAFYVDKILKGSNSADLPVEQPTKFEFVVNLKTAKQIGLAIPPAVLYRADKVIK